MKQKLLKFISATILIALPIFALAQTAVDPAFNPNQLISDTAFSDTQTFGGAARHPKVFGNKGFGFG